MKILLYSRGADALKVQEAFHEEQKALCSTNTWFSQRAKVVCYHFLRLASVGLTSLLK